MHSLQEPVVLSHGLSLRVKVVSENGFRSPGEPLFSQHLLVAPAICRSNPATVLARRQQPISQRKNPS